MILFKQWRVWFGRQPWSFRWFLWLILLRPVVDLFWFVKESSIVSPLQITGFLTFSLAVVFAFQVKVKRTKRPWSLLIFILLLIFNQVLIIAEMASFSTVVNAVRIVTPLFVLVYTLKVINSQQRLHGLLITYLISSVIPMSLLLYETLFDPISYHELPESRGGGYRLSGPYADMFNYLAYLIGDFLILGYFFVRGIEMRKPGIAFWKLALVLFVFAFGIKGVQHQATWLVFFALIGLTGYFTVSNKRVKGYILTLMIPLVLIGPVVVFPVFEKLFAKEINAYTGEADQKKVLNGRLIRWENYFGKWGETTVVPKLIGISVSQINPKTKKAMVGGGMHSDYVRFLFGTGFIGLFSLLMFYLSVYLNGRSFAKAEQYFITGCLIAILLYSVTSNPLGGSASLLYLLSAGLAVSMQQTKAFYPVQKGVTSPAEN